MATSKPVACDLATLKSIRRSRWRKARRLAMAARDERRRGDSLSRLIDDLAEARNSLVREEERTRRFGPAREGESLHDRAKRAREAYRLGLTHVWPTNQGGEAHGDNFYRWVKAQEGGEAS